MLRSVGKVSIRLTPRVSTPLCEFEFVDQYIVSALGLSAATFCFGLVVWSLEVDGHSRGTSVYRSGVRDLGWVPNRVHFISSEFTSLLPFKYR